TGITDLRTEQLDLARPGLGEIDRQDAGIAMLVVVDEIAVHGEDQRAALAGAIENLIERVGAVGRNRNDADATLDLRGDVGNLRGGVGARRRVGREIAAKLGAAVLEAFYDRI